MKITQVVAGFAASANAFTPSIFHNDDNVAVHGPRKIPTSFESAVIGRRVLALTKLATLSTVFPNNSNELGGVAVGLMDYVADCEEEGNPTILEIKIGTTFKNVHAGSNITVSMNWVPPYPPAKRISFLSRLSAYVPFLSSSEYNEAASNGAQSPDTVPYSAANLPRFSLIGYLEPIETNPVTSAKLASCFTSKHPDAKYWLPGNVIHSASWARLVVTKVYFIGGFGDRAYIGWIPVEEWNSVTRADWESIKLQGEERGWNEWSVKTAGEL